MTTPEPRPQAAYPPAYLPAVRQISRLGQGQIGVLDVPTGAGKSRILAAAVAAFLERKTECRALVVSRSLTTTQHAEAIEAHGLSVTLVRDKEEMRAWLYHSSGPTARVLVVAEPLIGSAAAAALLDAALGLAVIADAEPHLVDFVDALSVSGAAVVVIGSSAALNEARRMRNALAHAIPIISPPLKDLLESTPPTPARELRFPIAQSERYIITETVEAVSTISGDTAEFLRKAALSSRAAFSAALLTLRSAWKATDANIHPQLLFAVEPGSRRFDALSARRTDQDAFDGPQLLPAAQVDIILQSLEVDAVLDAIDDLGTDHKLQALGKAVAEEELDLVLFVQNSATARYIEQTLSDQDRGIVFTRWRKQRKYQDPNQLPLFSHREILIVADPDLRYLGEPLHSYRHLWFDPPTTTRHGRRRSSLRAPHADPVQVLIAQPPLFDEASRYIASGLALPLEG